MTLNKVSALCALACVAMSGQAMAATALSTADQTIVDDANTNKRVIFIAGASAVQKGFDAIINGLFSSTPIRFKDVASGTANYEAVAGPLKLATANWAANSNVIVIYRVKGGSGYGVFPVARNTPIDSLNVTSSATDCTAGSGTTAAPYVCAVGALSRAPDAGISDVAPALFDDLYNTEGETPQTALTPTELADLTVTPLYGLAFGLPVTSTVPTTTVFTKSMVAAILTGAVQNWKAVDSSLAADDILICRRTPGSGTQAVVNLYYGNYPCDTGSAYNKPLDRNNVKYTTAKPRGWNSATSGTNPRSFIVDGTNAGKTIVIENAASGDVRKCLDAASLGHDFADATKPATYTTSDRDGKTVTVSITGAHKAIGVLSMDSLGNSVATADSTSTGFGNSNALWQFRALDGAGTYVADANGVPVTPVGTGKYPTKDSYLSGLWDMQGWESFQTPSRTSGDKLEVLTTLVSLAQDPAVLNGIGSLKYVTAALPGTADPTATGLVLKAGYLNNNQCAPYNHR